MIAKTSSSLYGVSDSTSSTIAGRESPSNGAGFKRAAIAAVETPVGRRGSTRVLVKKVIAAAYWVMFGGAPAEMDGNGVKVAEAVRLGVGVLLAVYDAALKHRSLQGRPLAHVRL